MNMTDIDYFTALEICTTADPQHKRCGRCPLLHCEIDCETQLRYETHNRLVRARQEKAAGVHQLTFMP